MVQKKLTQEHIDKIYVLSLKGFSSREIAKITKFSQSTISRALDSIIKDHNYQLSVATVGVFLEQYHRYGDFLTNQVKELEIMKGDEGQDKLELMDAQFKRMEALIEKAGKGKLVLALRDMMKDEFERTGEHSKGIPIEEAK